MVVRPRSLGCLVLITVLAAVVPSTNVGALATAAQCTLVELYPGYPGYQGFVTGVDGMGDHVCLEDLESQNPSFSKSREDRLNRAAAETLGIKGPMNVWTWENWMAIEAERDLIPTCYSCAFVAGDARLEPQGVSPDSDDPRLLAGRLLGTTIADRYATENGIFYRGTPLEDYQLRAWAYLVFTDDHPNADDLLKHYETLLDAWHSAIGDGGLSLYDSIDDMCRTLIEQGGYFPVPSTAHPDDQLFAMYIGLYSFAQLWTPDYSNVVAGIFDEYVRAWQYQYSDEMNFGEYLRSVNAASIC